MNQPTKDHLNSRCYICTGFAIDSQLYLYGRWSPQHDEEWVHMYEIHYTNEAVTLNYKNFHRFDSFNEIYPIFFHANASFPRIPCEIGYRNENNECVDIDECKIMRHYCDSRKRFLI